MEKVDGRSEARVKRSSSSLAFSLPRRLVLLFDDSTNDHGRISSHDEVRRNFLRSELACSDFRYLCDVARVQVLFLGRKPWNPNSRLEARAQVEAQVLVQIQAQARPRTKLQSIQYQTKQKEKHTFEITLPAATTLHRPIRTPGRMVTLLPIHTSFSITMLLPSARPVPLRRSRGSIG